MLSYLYRIATAFEQSHHIRPNLLYLSPTHYRELRMQLEHLDSRDALVQLLGMEIIITSEAIHPHVVAINLQQSPARAM